MTVKKVLYLPIKEITDTLRSKMFHESLKYLKRDGMRKVDDK